MQDEDNFATYVNLPAIRKAIHVGDLMFNSGAEVEKNLMEDVMKSIKPWIEEVRRFSGIYYADLIY